jgi:predicted DNA-binding protein with PD1-like motif
MVETMTQATKDRIAELERQKIEFNDQLEILGYTGNLVKMHQIEEQIFEIEDTIKKLTNQ